jgi:hypothetical protein
MVQEQAMDRLQLYPGRRTLRTPGMFQLFFSVLTRKGRSWVLAAASVALKIGSPMFQCYYTFAGSQRNFLMHLGYSASNATSLNAAFSILCYLFPILGGWVADSFLGRYKTILLFSSIYVVGVFIGAASAWPTFDNEVWQLKTQCINKQ